MAASEVNDLLAGLRRRGLRLIAERVETPVRYEAMRALKFDAYQGQYFAAPRSIREVVAPTHRLGALVSLTHRAAGASLEDLERHICEDPGLSYRFVRLANSAFYGGRTPVGSIRQALMRLGAVTVSQWIMLFALSKMTDRPQHLLNTAVHRARLCELLAREYPDTIPELAFSAGLFSVLDALLGRPMRELIADLCLDDRLATAITDHRGPEGRLLAAVLAYERGDLPRALNAMSGWSTSPTPTGTRPGGRITRPRWSPKRRRRGRACGEEEGTRPVMVETCFGVGALIRCKAHTKAPPSAGASVATRAAATTRWGRCGRERALLRSHKGSG